MQQLELPLTDDMQGRAPLALVALTGPARSGKDTVGRMLHQRYGYTPVAFADPMRDALTAMLRVPPDVFLPENKERPLHRWGVAATPRKLMQTLGTEWGRDLIDRDLWLTLAGLRIASLPRVVITDLRFNNEAHWVRRQGGAVLHLRRDAAKRGAVRPHVSENGVDAQPEDLFLNNSGTVAELSRGVDRVVAQLRARRPAAPPCWSAE